MTVGPQRVRRPSRPTSNRRRRGELLSRIPRPRAVAAAATSLARKNLGPAIALATVALVSGGGYATYRWMITTPRLAVARFEVEGNRRLTDDELIARIADARGRNLFSVEIGALEAAIEREPHVARAEIHRSLPDGLVVEVVEHAPAAVVELGGLYLADARGRLFARARTERDALDGLPVLTGLDRAAVARDPGAAAGRIVAALAIAAAWRRDPRPPLGELHLDEDRGTTLYLRDPAIAVHLGTIGAEAIDRRLAAFDAAWAALDAAERARIASIHLGRDTSPERVTVAFAELN